MVRIELVVKCATCRRLLDATYDTDEIEVEQCSYCTGELEGQIEDLQDTIAGLEKDLEEKESPA